MLRADSVRMTEGTALRVASPLPSSDRRWALGVGVATMAATMLPYLFGWSLLGLQPERGWFSWFGCNLDDSCVYLSWLRQAAEGHFFQRNLFTTLPQAGHSFNLFFLALGTLSRLLHLPLIAVWHGARLFLGVALLRAVWWLLEQLLADARARRTAFLLVCISAGLGWLFWQASGAQGPVDVWQTEAITFLCLYLNPLFIVSLLLMVGVIGWLLIAERTRTLRPALYAGLCGFLLGNIHTYDVLTVSVVWAAFLAVRTVVERRFEIGAWGRALAAGLPMALSTGYTAYLIRTEAVFAQRAAVPTLSASPQMVALGYGLLLPLALFGGFLALRSFSTRRDTAPTIFTTREAGLFLVVWAAANVAVSYVPVSFQRKMLMGAHLPIAILAGVGLWWCLERLFGRKEEVGGDREKRSGGWGWTAGVAGAVVLLSLTNGRFLLRDIGYYEADRGNSGIQRPYLYAGEVAALDWICEHTSPDAPIQPLPWILADEGRVGFFDTTVAALAPGLTGHPVHAGHWGETPDFGATMGAWVTFQRSATSDDWRKDLLHRSGVRYILFTQKHVDAGIPTIFHGGALPAYLRLVPEASNADADVYEVASLP